LSNLITLLAAVGLCVLLRPACRGCICNLQASRLIIAVIALLPLALCCACKYLRHVLVISFF
jgi:hypothetical protein